MPSRTDRTDGVIDWPDWAPRTPPADRDDTSKYRVSLARAIEEIATELEDRIDVDDWRLSPAAAHRKRDGLPYANADPDDPGAVVWWSKAGEQYAAPCDRYTDLLSNVRTVGKYLTEKRKMEGRPVKTAQSEFATARLPPGDDEPSGVVVHDPREVLELPEDEARVPVIEAAARDLKATYHPDQPAGDETVFKRVQEAEEMLLDELDDA